MDGAPQKDTSSAGAPARFTTTFHLAPAAGGSVAGSPAAAHAASLAEAAGAAGAAAAHFPAATAGSVLPALRHTLQICRGVNRQVTRSAHAAVTPAGTEQLNRYKRALLSYCRCGQAPQHMFVLCIYLEAWALEQRLPPAAVLPLLLVLQPRQRRLCQPQLPSGQCRLHHPPPDVQQWQSE